MKHRRNVEAPAGKRVRERNTAECGTRGARGEACKYVFCPRHAPENYVEYMARHTPESIRNLPAREA